MSQALGPGATIGIIGGGQLGNMIVREAHRMGYRVHVMDPGAHAPAGKRADAFTVAPFDDIEGLQAVADESDVVTLEIEHVPAEGLDQIAAQVPVRPRPAIFDIVQDRANQRAFLTEHGFPQPRNQVVDDLDGLQKALETTGTPAVLKTRRGGYDGRGQARIKSPEDAEKAWGEIGGRPAVLESFVTFEREVSVVLARGLDGRTQAYPPAENVHVEGILHTSRVPARLDEQTTDNAVALTRKIAEALDHVGVLCVELFVTKDGELLVNEIAPRIHNSGHFTEAACSIAQGAQHLRAITGQALAPAVLYQPAVMVNLLGDAWEGGPPDWSPVLDEPNARLHLYGKAEPRKGRKMGHIIVLDDDPQLAHDKAVALHGHLMKPLPRAPTAGRS